MGGGPQAARRGSESEKRSRTKPGSPPLSSPTSSVQGMRRDRQQTEGREGAIGEAEGRRAGVPRGKPGTAAFTTEGERGGWTPRGQRSPGEGQCPLGLGAWTSLPPHSLIRGVWLGTGGWRRPVAREAPGNRGCFCLFVCSFVFEKAHVINTTLSGDRTDLR